MRAAPQIKLKLGTVVYDVENQPWVFVGYGLTTISHTLRFFCVKNSYLYHAVNKETLERKFPGISGEE